MTIRLNKVTRDLNVGITTVVEFLQKKGYAIEASPNAKITEEQYAVLVKEFSTDKNLKKESEKFIQERQNKDRNKASIAIAGYEEKKKEEEIDLRPKFKPVGKIDLDSLNKRPSAKKVEEPVKVEEKPEPVVEPVVEPEKTKPVVEEPVIGEEYVVQKGDTLSKIAKACGVTVKELVAANNIENPNLIRKGATLIIPKVEVAKRHIVVKGDTLGKIAKAYGCTIKELVELNKLENPNLIIKGQVIVLP